MRRLRVRDCWGGLRGGGCILEGLEEKIYIKEAYSLIMQDKKEIIEYFGEVNSEFASVLAKDDAVLEFVSGMMNKPNWLVGLSWSDMKEASEGMKEFKLVKSDIDDIKKRKKEIGKYERFIVMIRFPAWQETLDEGKHLVEHNFHELYVYQLFAENGLKKIKIDFLMMR